MEQESLRSLAERKVDYLKRSIQLHQGELQALEELIGHERRQLNAWLVIMTSEPSDGAPETIVVPDETEPDPHPTRMAYRDISTGKVRMDVDAYGSKTAEVRKMLLLTGTQGVTAREVADYLLIIGLRVSSNFASNTLHKMKERGEVIALGDRFVLSQFVVKAPPLIEEEVPEETS